MMLMFSLSTQGFAVPAELNIAKKMEPMKTPSRVDADCVLCILNDLQVAVSTAGGVVWILEPKAGNAELWCGCDRRLHVEARALICKCIMRTDCIVHLHCACADPMYPGADPVELTTTSGVKRLFRFMPTLRYRYDGRHTRPNN